MSFYLKNKVPIYNAGILSARSYLENDPVGTQTGKVSLVISPFLPPLVPVEIVSGDLSGLLIDLQMSKSRSQPAGFFNFTLAADDDSISRAVTSVRGFRRDLEELLQPRTMVQVWRDGLHRMTGYVERFQRIKSPQGGRALFVECSELGQLYDQSILTKQLRVYGEGTFLNSTIKALENFGSVSGIPAPLAINLLVQAFLASTYNYGGGNTVNYRSQYLSASDGLPLAFRLIAQPAPIGALSYFSLMQRFILDTAMFFTHDGASFWQYLKQLCPEPWMELYTESGGRTICTAAPLGQTPDQLRQSLASVPTGVFDQVGAGAAVLPNSVLVTPMLPGFNYLVMRTSPYDNPMIGFSYFKQLYALTLGVWSLIAAGDYVIITEEDVTDSSLGQDMTKAATVFQVPFTASQGSGSVHHNVPALADGPTNPLYPGGRRTYGTIVREHSFPINSLDFAGIAAQTAEPHRRNLESRILASKLAEWFRNNDKFREGSITVRSLPHARPGMVLLYLPRRGKRSLDRADHGLYYIDSVTEQFAVGSPETATLNVIRGTPLPMTGADAVDMISRWEVRPPSPIP